MHIWRRPFKSIGNDINPPGPTISDIVMTNELGFITILYPGDVSNTLMDSVVGFSTTKHVVIPSLLSFISLVNDDCIGGTPNRNGYGPHSIDGNGAGGGGEDGGGGDGGGDGGGYGDGGGENAGTFSHTVGYAMLQDVPVDHFPVIVDIVIHGIRESPGVSSAQFAYLPETTDPPLPPVQNVSFSGIHVHVPGEVCTAPSQIGPTKFALRIVNASF